MEERVKGDGGKGKGIWRKEEREKKGREPK